jgi:hypothetical protein
MLDIKKHIRFYLAIFINLIIYICFSGIYISLYKNNKNNFNEIVKNNEDLFYFSAFTHTTTGAGDIFPITTISKRVASLHVMLVLIFNIIIILW